MREIIILAILLVCQFSNGQMKNFIDKPYLETIAKVDTLIKPNLIYLKIRLDEKDKRNRISIEKLEKKMFVKLQSLKIDVSKQLKVSDLGSGYIKYFLKEKQILKKKTYELEIYTAKKAGEVLIELEKIGISNVNLYKIKYSKIEELRLRLKSIAVKKAKRQAMSMLEPLNQKIVKAIHISDLTGGNRRFKSNNNFEEIIVAGYSSSNKGVYKAPQIEIRPIKVESEVSVKFEIE